MFAASLYEKIGFESSAAVAILSIAMILIAGFLMTRITKKLRLPNVTAYILAGILIGPFGLDLIPPNIVEGMNFLPDIALSFIAFSTGEYFRFETLKKNGIGVVIITLAEAIFATIFVFILCFFVLRLSLPFSIVLAALAAATAPASTMMTIRQVHAKGSFVDTLLEVVALDDLIGLVAYSVAVSIATLRLGGTDFSLGGVLLPFLLNIGMLALGSGFGYLTMLFMKNRHSSDNRLIIAITMLFSFCGICALLETSPLLGCMAMATVYINLTEDERLFRQLNYFSPPILMIFFVRSGISFDLGALVKKSGSVGSVPLLAVGIGYFLVRIVGKYVGAFLGCQAVHTEKNVRNYLGLALIPQAGVAIGLAELGARTLGGESGKALYTIILASSVLYELIGPVCAKGALFLSGSYSEEEVETVPVPTPLPPENRDEAVYSEEAEQHYLDMAKGEEHKKKHKKRKQKKEEKKKKDRGNKKKKK
ncbi:MAG: cation:proton antiporter [Lachnospiraceae bacterium]|nr:cation:proton antiporter [Lachnospiraceae bacterium]